MSDRINGLTVVIERGIRDEDAQAIIDAIRMVKGVVSVQKHVADHTSHFAYVHARHELERRLYNALRDATKDEKIDR